ncbi:grhN [Nocardia neocaledoniensis]|uniref:grhN n=1 Tax=Nocardia neocaledoniensis TaxID=236511 RepID=UPI002453FC8F|nr:grhN [Nocardia neocaledoniensis]
MTTTTTRVRLAPPPPALMRMINPLVRRVLSNPRLGRRIPLQALLEFPGRHSGKTFRVPVCLHTIDGVPTVFTERRWRLNFTDPVPVTVTTRGRVRHGRAVLLRSTPQELGTALRQAMDNGATPFELGLKVARGHTPTVEDLSAIVRWRIRIDFADEE